MSDSLISSLSPLERLKQQRELQQRPFPLWALLTFCETGNRNDWYCNYFEGFKLLASWLGPIELPVLPVLPVSQSTVKIPRLHRTYEIQEIATILNTSQEVIYHGYSVTFSQLFKSTHTAFMPPQVST